MKINRYRAAVFCCLISMILYLPVRTMAAGFINTQAVVNLTIALEPEGKQARDVVFRLYRVGEVSSVGEFTVTDTFAGYGIDLTEATEDTFLLLAGTLPEYIAADGIKADYIGKTDTEGLAVFEALSAGLYLVIGEEYHVDQKTVTPAPFLISLPNKGVDGSYQYDVAADAKYSIRSDLEPAETEVPDTDSVRPHEEGKLPQTGVLWWPVPVLAAAGACMILWDCVCCRKKGKKGEESEEGRDEEKGER